MFIRKCTTIFSYHICCCEFFFYFFDFIIFSATFVADNGVAIAFFAVLVKGNPVEIRSYTRSCKFFNLSAFILPLLRLEWEGVERERARKPALSGMFYKDLG